MKNSLISQLERKIGQHQKIAGNLFTVGIALHNLATNEKLIINNRPFSAASTIKILIMIAVYKKVEAKLLRLNTTITFKENMLVADSPYLSKMKTGQKISIKRLTEYMIIVSDNTATNILVDILSMDYINEIIQSLNLKDTILQRKMADREAMESGMDNWTSPGEMAEILKELITGNITNKKHTASMIKILCQQKDREKIPALLPNDIMVGNKPGELEGIRHDVGIIFSPNGTYILSIFCDHLLCTDKADEWMSELSRLIYDYFNPVSQKKTEELLMLK